MSETRGHRHYDFEDFRLDVDHLLLFRNGEQLALTPKVVETLLALIESRGEIVSKDELMRTVWPNTSVEEGNLSQNLYILRKSLGKTVDGRPFIETLRRRGYRFNAVVEEITNGFRSEGKTSDLDRGELRAGRRDEGNVLTPDEETAQHREHSASGSKLSNRRSRVAAAVLVTVVISTMLFVWLRYSSNSKNVATKDDVSIVNLTDGENIDFATISPDGNYFCYVSHDGEKAHLMLQQTGESRSHEITEPFSGNIYNTTFTPDSQFVYFIVNEGLNSDHNILYRVPTLGGVRTKVSTVIESTVSFSPDGREMVFLRIDRQSRAQSMIIASSDGSRERDLLTMEPDKARSILEAAWSPDGKTIAYCVADPAKRVDGAVSIVGVDPQNGETRPLSQERWDSTFRMAWTRDSQGLVFIGTKANESLSTRQDQIYYLTTADRRTRRISTEGNRYQPYSLGMTDKDEILAVPFNRLSQIWSMDASGDARSVAQITTGHADGRGGIAPLTDGRVGYLTRNGDGFSIWLMNADGSNRRQLTTEPSAIEELRSPPDGRFFIFSVTSAGWSHLYRIDPSGGNLMQLTFGESKEIDSTISPDGNWIVYDSLTTSGSGERSTLWKMSSDGGEPVRLADFECYSPNYSSDGKFISCVFEDSKKISILSADDGTPIKTFELRDHAVLNIGAKWTIDGKSLAYIVQNKNVGNIRLQPVNGDPSQPLTDFTSGDIYNFAFATDGTKLFTARGYQTRNAVLIKNFR